MRAYIVTDMDTGRSLRLAATCPGSAARRFLRRECGSQSVEERENALRGREDNWLFTYHVERGERYGEIQVSIADAQTVVAHRHRVPASAPTDSSTTRAKRREPPEGREWCWCCDGLGTYYPSLFPRSCPTCGGTGHLERRTTP